jgi:hypothetical protein
MSYTRPWPIVVVKNRNSFFTLLDVWLGKRKLVWVSVRYRVLGLYRGHLVVACQDSTNDRRYHSIPWGLTLRLLLAGLTCLSTPVVPQKQP